MTKREYLLNFTKELEETFDVEFCQGRNNIEAFEKLLDKFLSQDYHIEKDFNDQCEEYEENARRSIQS